MAQKFLKIVFLYLFYRLHHWGQTTNPNSRKCPVCLRLGPAVKLSSGIETSFYIDSSPPTHTFSCGHMASEKTVKTWSSIAIPHGVNGFHHLCPFCATALDDSINGVKLIFQDHVD